MSEIAWPSDFLTDMPRLETLVMTEEYNVTDTLDISRIPTLKHLRLERGAYTFSNLSKAALESLTLSKLPNLTQLHLPSPSSLKKITVTNNVGLVLVRGNLSNAYLMIKNNARNMQFNVYYREVLPKVKDSYYDDMV